MRITIDRLKVLFNNKVVGYLQEKEGQVGFQYDDEWLKTGFNISPFKLPLKSGIFYADKTKLNGLFGVFNDCLPDGWGTLLTIKMLNQYKINYETLPPLVKLSLIRKSGLGGLEFEPCQSIENNQNDTNLDILSEKVNQVLNDDYSRKTLDEIYGLGGSSGGARPKAHIKIDNDEWIVKFKGNSDPKNIGIEEFKANSLAKQCGINVNEFKLFESKTNKGYFGTKRFDRRNSKKIHVISLSGLLDVYTWQYNLDYSVLFQVIQAISIRPKEDKIEAYKRMCFNVLYDNRDDHAKNWSFLYDEDLKGYVLSPFYDITKCPNQFRSMLVFDKENPTEQDLLKDAKYIGIDSKTAKSIINKIKSVIKS